MIGIYKITSPDKKIYIGQSVNLKRRLKDYKANLAKDQKLLNYSFLKYGFKNHKFEIIHICNIEELSVLERYYQILFNCVGSNGLNSLLVNEKQSYIHNKYKIDFIIESEEEINKRKKIINIIDSIVKNRGIGRQDSI